MDLRELACVYEVIIKLEASLDEILNEVLERVLNELGCDTKGYSYNDFQKLIQELKEKGIEFSVESESCGHDIYIRARREEEIICEYKLYQKRNNVDKDKLNITYKIEKIV